MLLEDIFSDLVEVEVAGEIQLESPFLNFLLKKKREFFIVRSISIIGDVTPKNPLPKVVYLRGEKLLHGGLQWSKWELKYSSEEIFRMYDFYISDKKAEKRERDINNIIGKK